MEKNKGKGGTGGCFKDEGGAKWGAVRGGGGLHESSQELEKTGEMGDGEKLKKEGKEKRIKNRWGPPEIKG